MPREMTIDNSMFCWIDSTNSSGDGSPVAALTLAFAPGGLAEMTLIALALGVDPAFVSTHHVVRIFLVVILAPIAFKIIAPRLGIVGGGTE